MTTIETLLANAQRSAERLRRLNLLVLVVAVVVYVGVLGIAVIAVIPPLGIFATCILLAELLVFHIVRALGDHFELIRASSQPR